MAEALQQRVLELEADLREERRSRVKLERQLKLVQQERTSLADDLKMEKKASEKNVSEVKAAQLDRNKLLINVDQLNKKLEAATAELVRLRSEVKLKDKICNLDPHPPPQAPPRRKAKTRSAPSNAVGVMDADKGAAARAEELEALLDVARHEKARAEKLVKAEQKKRSITRREMSELAAAATGGCERGQWALQWVRQGVTAVDAWLSSMKVKDTNNGVWSQGLTSTKSTIQYMKMVLASGSEAMEQLVVDIDRARGCCGQPVTSGAEPLKPPKVRVQDGSEEAMRELIQVAEQQLAAEKQRQKEQKEAAAAAGIPQLRIPTSYEKVHTPRGRGELGSNRGPGKASHREAESEPGSSRTVPAPSSHRSKEGLRMQAAEPKSKRGSMLPPAVAEGRYSERGRSELPPPVSQGGYAAVPSGRKERGVRDPIERNDNAQQDGEGYAGRQRNQSDNKHLLAPSEEEENAVASSKAASEKTSRTNNGGGGYMDQYRRRHQHAQRNAAIKV